MLKLMRLLIFCLTIIIFSSFDFGCSNFSIHTSKSHFYDASIYKKIIGTWIHHDSVSFTLIEINDTSNVDITYYFDLKKRIDTLTNDRFIFIKAKGKLTFWNDSTFNLDFTKFWFDFKIKNDTLFEKGKDGDDAKYFKMNQKEDLLNINKFGQFPIH